jgi:hypothetical protein
MKDLTKYVRGYSSEFTGDDYIDIAVEFSLELFHEAGISIDKTEDGYIETDLGVFYCGDNDWTWFWAITNKKASSRDFDHVGKLYLTDSESGARIPMNKKIWADFKKAIEPKLNKALKKFAREEELI